MNEHIDFSKFTSVANTSQQDEANRMIDLGWTLLDAGIRRDSARGDSEPLFVLGWSGEGPPPLPHLSRLL